VGVDEENMELVVGIIDFMRQYDIMKQMERVGKSLPMVRIRFSFSLTIRFRNAKQSFLHRYRLWGVKRLLSSSRRYTRLDSLTPWNDTS
jgi:hypothetical protein